MKLFQKKSNPKRRKRRTSTTRKRKATITVRLNPRKPRRKAVATRSKKRKRPVKVSTRRKLSIAARRTARRRKQPGRKHRLTIYKTRSGRVSRSRRSRVVGRRTRINPRRRTRRNPIRRLGVKSFINRRLVMRSVTFLAGLVGGLFIQRQAKQFVAFIPPQFQGVIPLLIGGWLAINGKKQMTRSLGGGIFAAGILDLATENLGEFIPFLPSVSIPNGSVSGTNFIPGGPAQVVGGMGAAINSYQTPQVVGAFDGGEADFVDSIENFG